MSQPNHNLMHPFPQQPKDHRTAFAQEGYFMGAVTPPVGNFYD
jgi:hypothetical protein